MAPRVSWGMVLVTSAERAKGAMQPVTRVVLLPSLAQKVKALFFNRGSLSYGASQRRMKCAGLHEKKMDKKIWPTYVQQRVQP